MDKNKLYWICKYCGENEKPKDPYCVREGDKIVFDELAEKKHNAANKIIHRTSR